MSEKFGFTIRVRLAMLSRDKGGKARPILSGYRPLCVIRNLDGSDTTIGLCELQLCEGPSLAPGDTAEVLIRFHEDVADLAKRLLMVGTDFNLAEGAHIFGLARVLQLN
jgi:translation elongation factor EF-Tu-like GTPase